MMKNPQLNDEKIAEIMNDKEEMEARVYVFPTYYSIKKFVTLFLILNKI